MSSGFWNCGFFFCDFLNLWIFFSMSFFLVFFLIFFPHIWISDFSSFMMHITLVNLIFLVWFQPQHAIEVPFYFPRYLEFRNDLHSNDSPSLAWSLKSKLALTFRIFAEFSVTKTTPNSVSRGLCIRLQLGPPSPVVPLEVASWGPLMTWSKLALPLQV